MRRRSKGWLFGTSSPRVYCHPRARGFFFFSLCICRQSCAAGWICRVLETNAKRPSMSPTSHWQWILFWRQLEPERPAEEAGSGRTGWGREKQGGEIFPARTCCSGTVSPGSCLGPVEEEGGCVFVCVGGGEVYVDREIRWHSGKACEKTEHLSARWCCDRAEWRTNTHNHH